jgi:hypothetical protein
MNRTRTLCGVAAIAIISLLGLRLKGQSEGPVQQEQKLSDLAGKTVEPASGGLQLPGSHQPASPQSQRSRYKTLLREFEAPDDRQSYGDFCDYGYWSGTSYAGQEKLPPGYWVYLAPKWYIFQDQVGGASPGLASKRPWGPEQATGAPDTWPRSGDLTTSWASQTPDGQPEWLELSYSKPSRPSAVLVYETFNPGAVDRVVGFDAQGKEVEMWSGQDPTPAGKEKGISIIPVHPDFDLSRIRIYLDSPKVTGWNEIDAVGLLDESGETHWAASATASSTYADQASPAEGAPAIDLSAKLLRSSAR